jgi:DNA replication protein DnaC
MTTQRKTDDPSSLLERAQSLGLWGLVEHWTEISRSEWIRAVIELEEGARGRRSLERRIRSAKLGKFKPMCDFDWKWPRKIDRALLDDIFALDLLDEGVNVVLLGSNGVGKTMIARNLAHQAILRGATARFTTASEILNDLAAQLSPAALERRLRNYCAPQLLALDEVGYLSTSSEHADLLFEIVSRRYELRRPIVLTTNKPFSEWGQVFPSSTIVLTLVDRLIHRCEIVSIDADSYRKKEAEDRGKRRELERKNRSKKRKSEES